MGTGHDREAEATRLLSAASAEYGDLPTQVADRLDRVLDQLPAADTLHRAAAEPRRETVWERLRLGRVRFALVSAAAALLVTVGAVALAVQVVSNADGEPEGATAADQGGTHELGDNDAGAAPEAEDFNADEEEAPGLSPDGAEETPAGVETFATGNDYDEDADLLSALRGLGGEDVTGQVPDELAGLAAGGFLWEQCQQAIAARYDSLLVAADFARFESEPAVVALLLTDSGEIAVAVGPECAEGDIDELHSQS